MYCLRPLMDNRPAATFLSAAGQSYAARFLVTGFFIRTCDALKRSKS
jgi:hypothetical protein